MLRENKVYKWLPILPSPKVTSRKLSAPFSIKVHFRCLWCASGPRGGWGFEHRVNVRSHTLIDTGWQKSEARSLTSSRVTIDPWLIDSTFTYWFQMGSKQCAYFFLFCVEARHCLGEGREQCSRPLGTSGIWSGDRGFHGIKETSHKNSSEYFGLYSVMEMRVNNNLVRGRINPRVWRRYSRPQPMLANFLQRTGACATSLRLQRPSCCARMA